MYFILFLKCETGNHFKQDSASAHCARATAELFSRETPEFIAPELLPPNTPDLNHVNRVNYSSILWRRRQRRAWQAASLIHCTFKSHKRHLTSLTFRRAYLWDPCHKNSSTYNFRCLILVAYLNIGVLARIVRSCIFRSCIFLKVLVLHFPVLHIFWVCRIERDNTKMSSA